ncbi:MAG: MetQ/NlpA family ABC transporter substrate-binding protein [Chlamydiales bacterium]|nr:MetQ/NlpA family ABC transporter substrate-binding protein [Chlamydiales bacterium]
MAGLGLLLCCACNSSHKTLKIAATAVPHADLLEFVKEDLKDEGVNLKIVEIDDYNLPNRMLHECQVDANFFQHKPFLDEQMKMHGYDLVPLTAVHLEPLGIYSSVYKSLDEIKAESIVAIPQDPTNEARALMLLQDVGLIKLKDLTNRYLITTLDITENPKNLRFEELDAPYLPRALSDVDLAVIPSNFALQAKLNPSKDALALEGAESPYANIVVVKPGEARREEFQKLQKVLSSDKLRKHILEKYKGAILPAFENQNP